MTIEIALVLAIVLASVVLFVSGKLRVDLVALLVLGTLVLTQLVTPAEALSGFSNSAVVTVWAVFILSGGLARTGVAQVIGQQMMRVAGTGEFRLVFLIMITAALLSAFMNNVGVAALLLPVVVEIARSIRVPPSKLLLPLAFGALLGGLTTLIGTPPNILAGDALRENGLEAFTLFDFTPVGLAILGVGISFMLLIGRRLLPARDPVGETSRSADDLGGLYQLQGQILVLTMPTDSVLEGMTLAESQIGSLLDLHVMAIVRNGETHLSPRADGQLHAGDRLIVMGQPDELSELRRHQVDTLEHLPFSVENVHAAGIELFELQLTASAPIAGKTLAEADFRRRYGANVTAIRRGAQLIQREIASTIVQAGDTLVVQSRPDGLKRLMAEAGYSVLLVESAEVFRLNERLLVVRVPESSALVGRSLADSRLGRTYGLTVLQISRGTDNIVLPESDERIEVNDTLLVQSSQENIRALRGLEELQIEGSLESVEHLETAQIGLSEVVLSPHTTKAGRTLRELNFREKYGLTVLAIWRSGRAYREEISDMPLRFGDALLIYGPRARINILGQEPDYIVLAEKAQEAPRLGKAPLAVGIMILVLLTVLLGWLPIAIAAIIGGTLMVLTGCLTMEEAYRYIEWPAVFLIAAMLPLGIAMESSGTAVFLADGMMGLIGDAGPLAVLAGLFVLSVLASQVMPNAAVVVLMAPIAIASAVDMQVSPYTFMMGVAIAASASFMSPVSHPANILVMGPGGYRFADYIKVGLPLTLLVLVTVLLFLPLFWPF